MKRLLLSLIASFGLLTAYAADPGPAFHAFSEVCARTTLTCYQLPVPKLVYSDLSFIGAEGMYAGNARPDTVFMDLKHFGAFRDPKAYDLLPYSYLIHEMTHYVLAMNEGPAFDQGSLCESEAVAWAVQNQFLTDVGFPELAMYDWRDWYPDC